MPTQRSAAIELMLVLSILAPQIPLETRLHAAPIRQKSASGVENFTLMEIFPPVSEHVHGSTIVELPNGDLLAAWFQGSGERWADDVAIIGARRKAGSTQWSKPFLMADTPGFPDINPAMFLDSQERLWLVWYAVIANQWETSLLKYRISEDYADQAQAPTWAWQEVLHVKPGDPVKSATRL